MYLKLYIPELHFLGNKICEVPHIYFSLTLDCFSVKDDINRRLAILCGLTRWLLQLFIYRSLIKRDLLVRTRAVFRDYWQGQLSFRVSKFCRLIEIRRPFSKKVFFCHYESSLKMMTSAFYLFHLKSSFHS